MQTQRIRTPAEYAGPIYVVGHKNSHTQRSACGALRVTDMVGGTSRLLTCIESHYLDGLPFTRRSEGTFEMPDILSRKKQLLPAILSVLQQ